MLVMLRALHRWSEPVLLLFLVFSVLWRGGKSLDMVWLQALVASFLILVKAFERYRGKRDAKEESEGGLVWWLVLLFVLWTILSFLSSTAKNYGFDEVLQTVSIFLIFSWTASHVRSNPEFSAGFARVLSVTLLIACAIGIAVYIFQPVSRFVGTFFDYRFHTDYWPNAWAEFVLLAWPMLVATLFLRPHDDREGLWFQKCLVPGLVLGCLFLSYSRGAFIAFSGQAVLLGWWAWNRIPGVSRSDLTASVKALLAILLAAFILFYGINSIRGRFHTIESVQEKVTFTSAEGSSSVLERRAFFDQSLTLTALKPFLGFGPYSFRFVQPHVQDGILATSDHPHNVFLKLAVERGIVAAVLFAVVVAVSLFSAFKAANGTLKIENEKLNGRFLSAFMAVSIAGVLAHNLIDYNLQFVGIALPFWMILGMLPPPPTPPPSRLRQGFGGQAGEGRMGGRLSRFQTRVETVIAGLLLIATLTEGSFLFLSSSARRAERDGELSKALSLYASTDFSFFPRDAELSRSVLRLALGEFVEAERAVATYILGNPHDARGWRLLGDIYLHWNKRHDALRAYLKAYDYGKRNDAGILRGLVYLLKDQDREQLLERRAEFDSLLNDFAFAILLNTHFIALSKNVEEVLSLTELLAEVFPDERTEYEALAGNVREHAEEERAKYASRPRGMLW